MLTNDRFKGLDWVKKKPSDYKPVTVVGVGGIGSWITMLLTKIQSNITIIDDDKVELHNIGGQLLSYKEIGNYKVDAIRSSCLHFNGDYSVKNMITRLNEDNYFRITNSQVVFGCVDNMQTRKFIAKKIQQGLDVIFIDGRLLAECYQIYVVTKDNVEEYLNNAIFDDDEVLHTPCSVKQTAHAAAMIASDMIGIYTNILSNIVNNANIRSIPYYIEYDIPSMIRKTEGKIDII